MSMGASRWILTSKGPAEVGGGGHGIDTPSEAALPRIRPVVLGVWVGVCVGVWIGVGEGGGVGDGATTRMMSQIPPIDFKPTMIKRMHQLVRQRIFHMLLIEEPVLAK